VFVVENLGIHGSARWLEGRKLWEGSLWKEWLVAGIEAQYLTGLDVLGMEGDALESVAKTHHSNVQFYSTCNPDRIRIPRLIIFLGDPIHEICPNYPSDAGHKAKTK